MIITTTEQIAGKRIHEVFGLVCGFGARTTPGEKSAVIKDATSQALDDMKGKAAEIEGCNAVVGIKFSTVPLLKENVTALAYGTAVNVKDA